MHRVWKILVPVVFVAGAGYWYYQWRNSPEQRARRIERRMAAAARAEAARVDEMINSWSVVRYDDRSVVRRVIFSVKGARVDLDAGEQRVLGETVVQVYVERGSELGYQRGDLIENRITDTPSSKSKRSTWIQLPRGFKPELAPDARGRLLVRSVARNSKSQQVSDESKVLEDIGSGVDLGARDGRWRLLWKRQDGLLLRWRLDESGLSLDWSGLHDGLPAPQLVTADRQRDFAKHDQSWRIEIDERELETFGRRVSCVLSRAPSKQGATSSTWTVELVTR